MDSGQARSPGGVGRSARKSEGAAPGKQKPAATKPTAGGAAGRGTGGVGYGIGPFDAAGRDSVERAAAILAGAGQDIPASRSRLDALGKLAELPPDRYLDREESWLRFSQRVLELAEDPNVPLLERVRFESIFASALDEFFMVRVAGRIRRMATGLPVESVSGKAPDQILENTLDMARELADRHARCFSDGLLPALAESGIEILRWKELLPQEQAKLERLFKERIYPVLTPLAVDPAHPFPFISGLSLSLA